VVAIKTSAVSVLLMMVVSALLVVHVMMLLLVKQRVDVHDGASEVIWARCGSVRCRWRRLRRWRRRDLSVLLDC
jgi:hypothetical protein